MCRDKRRKSSSPHSPITAGHSRGDPQACDSGAGPRRERQLRLPAPPPRGPSQPRPRPLPLAAAPCPSLPSPALAPLAALAPLVAAGEPRPRFLRGPFRQRRRFCFRSRRLPLPPRRPRPPQPEGGAEGSGQLRSQRWVQ